MELAAPSAFGLQDLARNQATRFRRRDWSLTIARPLFFPLLHIGAWGARWFAMHHAERFAQQAVWFKGATAVLETKSLERSIDPADSLRVLLDDMEARLGLIGDSSIKLAAELRRADGKPRGRVRDALSVLSSTSAELAYDVRMFKAAVQAHDASVDAKTMACRPMAGTCASLEAELDSCLL